MSALSFSIIIPTYNRPSQLQTCLEALTRLDYPEERMQVIIVNDGGHSFPAQLMKYKSILPVQFFHAPHGGPAAARNFGVTRAEGDYLAFTDDDCQPDPSWLRAFSNAFQSHPSSAVGGKTLNTLLDNPYALTTHFIIDAVYAHYNADPLAAQFFASNNMAVPRLAFLEMGGFDSAHFPFASEDRNFCARWLARGLKMIYAQDALVYHTHPMGLGAYLRQYFRYGQGALRFYRLSSSYPTGTLQTQAGFYRCLVPATLAFLKTQPWLRAVQIPPLLLAWQAANAAGYLFESIRVRKTFPVSRLAENENHSVV